MSRFFGDTVERLRAPQRERKYGAPGPERDWGSAVTVEITGVSVQPEMGGYTEGVGDRPYTTEGLRLLTPVGVDIDLLATDRIRFAGQVYEVDGDVARFTVGGRLHHVEARLRTVSG